jgi:hypothetical protein
VRPGFLRARDYCLGREIDDTPHRRNSRERAQKSQNETPEGQDEQDLQDEESESILNPFPILSKLLRFLRLFAATLLSPIPLSHQ